MNKKQKNLVSYKEKLKRTERIKGIAQIIYAISIALFLFAIIFTNDKVELWTISITGFVMIIGPFFIEACDGEIKKILLTMQKKRTKNQKKFFYNLKEN